MHLSDEHRYRILKTLEANPYTSQRELARELGLSVGKINHCLKALVEVGMIKANNFKNSASKHSYMYMLTPKGIEGRAAVTAKFLRLKLDEHKNLQDEIAMLRREVIESQKGIMYYSKD